MNFKKHFFLLQVKCEISEQYFIENNCFKKGIPDLVNENPQTMEKWQRAAVRQNKAATELIIA